MSWDHSFPVDFPSAADVPCSKTKKRASILLIRMESTESENSAHVAACTTRGWNTNPQHYPTKFVPKNNITRGTPSKRRMPLAPLTFLCPGEPRRPGGWKSMRGARPLAKTIWLPQAECCPSCDRNSQCRRVSSSIAPSCRLSLAFQLTPTGHTGDADVPDLLILSFDYCMATRPA